jgi:hypothetical protein
MLLILCVKVGFSVKQNWHPPPSLAPTHPLSEDLIKERIHDFLRLSHWEERKAPNEEGRKEEQVQ